MIQRARSHRPDHRFESSYASALPSRLVQSGITFLALLLMIGCGGDNDIGAAGSGGRLQAEDPTVTLASPDEWSVPVGEVVVLRVGVDGLPTPNVQWQHRSPGADAWLDLPESPRYTQVNSDTLVMTASFEDHDHSLRAHVSNTRGVAHSDPVLITIANIDEYQAPQLLNALSDQSVIDGTQVSFTVEVDGTEPFQFQWQQLRDEQWQNLDESRADSLVFTARLEDDGSQYRCIVTNHAGTIETDAAALEVSPAPPTIIRHPRNFQAVVDGDAVFSVEVEGFEPLAIQWQVSTDDGASWNPIANANNPSVVIESVQESDRDSSYRALVSNVGGSVLSDSALLTVSEEPVAPTVITHPEDAVVVDGAEVSVSVQATGTSPLVYQWQRFSDGSWVDIADAISASYTFTAVTGEETLRCRVTNFVDQVFSDSAIISIGAAAPSITSQPDDLHIPYLSDALFTVEVSGTPPFEYQLQASDDDATWVDVAEITSMPELVLERVDQDMATRLYRIEVSNESGSVISDTAAITLKPAVPQITWPTAANVITYGDRLRSAGFSGGEATHAGEVVAGHFAMLVDTYPKAGDDQPYAVVFLPEDTDLYSVVNGTILVTVDPKPISITNASAQNKTYDATTQVNASGTLEGLLWDDQVSWEASFLSPNAGDRVEVIYSLTGDDAANYAIIQPGVQAQIAPKTVSLDNAQATDKEYNRTAQAVITADITGVIEGDFVGIDGSGTFAQVTVGTEIPVTAHIALTNTHAQNYRIAAQPTGLSAEIYQRELSIWQASAQNRQYDATTAVAISGTLFPIVSGDDVRYVGDGQLAQADVGDAVPVGPQLSLEGDDAFNYLLVEPENLTVNILPREVTVVNASAHDKVYDGNTDTVNVLGELENVIDGESVSWSSVFNDSQASNQVEIIYDLTGVDADNYTVIQPGLFAAIHPKEIDISNPDASGKIYDGTQDAEVTGTLPGIIGEDQVTLTGTFAQRNVASDIVVTFGLAGSDQHNYHILQPDPVVTADINAKELSIENPVGNDKVYDGTTDGSISQDLIGVVDGDDLVLEVTFADAQVGTAIAMNIALGGLDAGNYLLPSYELSADITQKELTLTAIGADNKVYDGTTDTTASATLVGVVVPDEVSVSAQLASANAGASVAVEWTLGGTDAGNYVLTDPNSVVEILPKELTIRDLAIEDKVYDGTTEAVFSGNLEGGITGDVVDFVITFADADAGEKSLVGQLTGEDAMNYSLAALTQTAQIEQRAVTITPLPNQGKRLGDGEPVLQFDHTDLIEGDAFDGALGRESGEEIGAYTYALATLTAGDNYVLSLNADGNLFTIGPSWAENYGTDTWGTWATFTISGNDVTAQQRMRWVPPGTFTMGSPDEELGRGDDETMVTVGIDHGFWLGDTTVSQELWVAVLGTNPSTFVDTSLQRPVESISWQQAQAFLDALEVLATFSPVLPTEAQWEYAVRAGTSGPFSFAPVNLDTVHVLPEEEDPYIDTGSAPQEPANAEDFPQNDLGLFAVHGNVWEWCADWYASERTGDVQGPEEGTERVLRGGGWQDSARRARSAARHAADPDSQLSDIGLRLLIPSSVMGDG